MSYLTDLDTLAETDKTAAAVEMTIALMRGDPAKLKAGYSAESAAMCAAERYGLPLADVTAALAPACNDVGFLRYLADNGGDISDVLRAVEKPAYFWQENAAYRIAVERDEA